MKRPATLLALLTAILLTTGLRAADQSPEIKAALAVGLGPDDTLLTIDSNGSFEQAIGQVRMQLKKAPTLQASVAYSAYLFVYGTEASEAVGANPEELFGEQVSSHLASLAKQPEVYQDVLQRAYRHVVSRDIYDEEIAYWSNHAPLPYALLVGCIEDWARRNQPGLMSTAGTPTVSINCELLQTQRVEPALAAEVAAWLGLASSTPVLSPGGAELKSSGGIRFLVTGVR